MARAISIGRKAFTTENFGDGTRLLTSVPRNTTFQAQILCDEAHVISGDICHYVNKGTEYCWEHCGPGDPGEGIDVQPRFSLMIPMVIKLSTGEKIIRTMRFPKSTRRYIEDIVTRFKTIVNAIVDVERDDSGEWTSYSIMPTGKFAKSPPDGWTQEDWLEEMLETIKAGTVEEIAEWLESEAGVSPSLEDKFNTEEF